MQVQGRQKMPLGDLLKAIDDCRSINELFALVHREGIVIQMRSQSSASNIAYKPLPKNPGVLPLDTLKKQVREAAIEASRVHSTEQLIRAIETCPTIDKLFELVKNEHIVIQMKSFNSASNLPQRKPSEMQMIPDKSPLDRLKEQVVDAVLGASRKHTKEQLIRAVETCPTIDKLFELVKNEHIVIRMKSFNSASNLPQQKPSEMQLMPDKTPLDRLKEQVMEAIMYAN
ncbi:MAG: hypothetical protein IJ639_04015 [Ruminococcus sp.]|nr:hypothetical protein [Ruminococcus sp.]